MATYVRHDSFRTRDAHRWLKPADGASPINLNHIMDMDHVIEVHEDGSVTDAPSILYPDLNDGELEGSSLWSLVHGFSGQEGYRGPIMHNSEFIGGDLADHILSTPGYYVALVNSVEHDEDDPEYIDNADTDGPDADGWAVAYRDR